MSTPAILRLTRLMLAALVALALTASAFAHRAPADPDRLAFLQATGASLADLCGDDGSGALAEPSCEACQIASLVLPSRPLGAMASLRPAFGGPTRAPDLAFLPTQPRDPAHLPQAPPAA